MTPAVLVLCLLGLGACNLAIGLEKQDLPEKPVVPCASNADCDDGHGCTQDVCELPQGECIHYMMAGGTVCRDKPAENVCDVEAEHCDGTSLDCPEDTFEPATLECRAAAGQCDEPEQCTGSSPLCPDDAFSSTEKECDDGNACTYDDRCDGAGGCLGTNGLVGVMQMSIGPWGLFGCALLPSNDLRCWGNNNYGQLGDGTTEHRSIPTPVIGLPETDEIVQLASGGRQVGVLLASGGIKAWGLGNSGQLGNGREGSGYFESEPVDVIGIPDGWSKICPAYTHTCGIQEDGRAYCWGNNEFGQLGIGTTTNALEPAEVTGPAGFYDIVGGDYHTCSIEPAGALWCWGRNDRGQAGDPAVGDPILVPVRVEAITAAVVDVAPGTLHTCALLEAGEVLCWGDNRYGQLGIGEGPDSTVPVTVSGLPTTIADIVSGYEHTCALMEAGDVMCWGHNDVGQLGDGTRDNIGYTPVSVVGLSSRVVTVGTGAFHTCAFLDDTSVWCWGINLYGELGNGTNEGSPTPVQVHCE